jgi:hypothetical protein
MLLCGHVVGHNPDGGLNDSARVERRRVTRAALTEHFGEEAVVNIQPTVVETRVAAPTELITVRIGEPTGEVKMFRVRLGQRLEAAFQTYGRVQHDVDPITSLRFMLDGERLLGHETAEMLELDDQDMILCLREMSGC